MARDDDDDRHEAGAPLIISHYADTFTQRREADGDRVEGPPLGGSGSRFMWALTLSAGISGFLFGYEYVLFAVLFAAFPGLPCSLTSSIELLISETKKILHYFFEMYIY